MMAIMWFFEIKVMAESSYMVDWLREAQDQSTAYKCLREGRNRIRIRGPETFPDFASLHCRQSREG
jgi:hypothetical protein